MQYVKDFDVFYDGVSLSEQVNNEAKKWYNFFINKNISIYHYTSQRGLEGILSSNSLWFTEASNLNDESEGYYLYTLFNDFLSNYYIDELFENFKNEIMKSIINIERKYFFVSKENGGFRALNTFPHYFICSFCKNEDALAMWNYYSKSDSKNGYNIRFSLRDLRLSVCEALHKFKLPGEFRTYKVLYNLQKQKKLLKNVIDFYYEKWKMTNYKEYVLYNLARYLYVIKYALKHPAFEPEQEVRLIIKVLNLSNEDVTINSDKILIRSTNDGFVPYISVPFNKSDIRHIKASPLTNYFESVHYLLQKYGYNNVDVDKSSIPLRF